MSIKWLKLDVNILDDQKIKLIDSLPESDAIFRIWIGLLCLAGQANEQGMLYVAENLPYSDEMLATVFRRPIATIRLALEVLGRFGMIEQLDNGVFLISNWEKHQEIEKLEKIREQTRDRVRKHRKKLLEVNNVKICVYCGGTATGVDHVIPVIKGGLNSLENYVPCCIGCNQSKNARDLSDFLNDEFSGINFRHDLIQSNPVLKNYIEYDKNTKRYVTRYVQKCNAIESESEQESDNKKNTRKKRTSGVSFPMEDYEKIRLRFKEVYLSEVGRNYIESIPRENGAIKKLFVAGETIDSICVGIPAYIKMCLRSGPFWADKITLYHYASNYNHKDVADARPAAGGPFDAGGWQTSKQKWGK